MEYPTDKFPGVSYDTGAARYIASKSSGYEKDRKTYSVGKLGEREAFFKAVMQRLKWEEEEVKEKQREISERWQRLINVLVETAG